MINKYIKQILTYSAIFLFTFITLFVSFTPSVRAAAGVDITGDCFFNSLGFPGLCPSAEIGNTLKSPGATITGIIINFINVFFFVVLLVGVVYTLKAALNYVRSEGDEKKVGQPKSSMKSILSGIALMFLSLIALLFISSFGGNDGSLTKYIDGVVEPIYKLIDGTPATNSTNNTNGTPPQTYDAALPAD